MAFKRPTVRSRSAPPFQFTCLIGESGRIDRPTVRSRSAPPFNLFSLSCPTLYTSSRVSQPTLLTWVILPILRKDLLNIIMVKACQREGKDLGGLSITKSARRGLRLPQGKGISNLLKEG